MCLGDERRHLRGLSLFCNGTSRSKLRFETGWIRAKNLHAYGQVPPQAGPETEHSVNVIAVIEGSAYQEPNRGGRELRNRKALEVDTGRDDAWPVVRPLSPYRSLITGTAAAARVMITPADNAARRSIARTARSTTDPWRSVPSSMRSSDQKPRMSQTQALGRARRVAAAGSAAAGMEQLGTSHGDCRSSHVPRARRPCRVSRRGG